MLEKLREALAKSRPLLWKIGSNGRRLDHA